MSPVCPHNLWPTLPVSSGQGSEHPGEPAFYNYQRPCRGVVQLLHQVSGCRPHPAPAWGLSDSASAPSQDARAVPARVKAQSYPPPLTHSCPCHPSPPLSPFRPPQEAHLQNLSLYSVVNKKAPMTRSVPRGDKTESPRCEAPGAGEQERGSAARAGIFGSGKGTQPVVGHPKGQSRDALWRRGAAGRALRKEGGPRAKQNQGGEVPSEGPSRSSRRGSRWSSEWGCRAQGHRPCGAGQCSTLSGRWE